MPFAAIWMNLEIIMLCEGCQTEKNKYYYITLMWNLKTNINVFIKWKQTHRH